MEFINEKLSNGNTINYKIVNGTAYKVETPSRVIEVLEQSLNSNQRVRLFYGDAKTGRDWLEENDTIGSIGRSSGKIQIPLLIKNARSSGGGGLLDECIVKITIGKTTVYQNKKYKLGEIEIKESDKVLQEQGLTHSVNIRGINQANFETLKRANNYVEFLKGNRNRI